MKKIILTVAAVFAMTFANAQEKEAKGFGFSEGDILLEGNIGFNSTNDKNSETKTNSFEFNPKAGYFLTDKFVVGVQLGIGSDKTEVAGNETDKNSNFDAGVFGRYYFLNLGERFKTYSEAGLNLNSGKDGLAEDKYSGIGFNVGLGINYFVTENIAINFGLTDILSYNSNKYDGAEAETELNGNVNVFNNFFDTANFGLTFKF